ncbi:hypothetical protein D3C72_1127300 [compost metagenome]
MLAHLVHGRLRHTQPLQRAIDAGVGVIDGDGAGHLHAHHFLALLEIPVEGASRAARVMHDAAVRSQVSQGVRRAVPRQVGGRGARGEAHQADLLADEGGILQGAHAQGAIDAFLRQVDQAVSQAQLQLHVRIRGMELRDMGNDQAPAHGIGQVDAQQATRFFRIRAAKRQFRRIDGFQDLNAVAKVFGPFRRQRQAARGSLQQLRAQVGFQLLQRGRQRGAR